MPCCGPSRQSNERRCRRRRKHRAMDSVMHQALENWRDRFADVLGGYAVRDQVESGRHQNFSRQASIISCIYDESASVHIRNHHNVLPDGNSVILFSEHVCLLLALARRETCFILFVVGHGYPQLLVLHQTFLSMVSKNGIIIEYVYDE